MSTKRALASIALLSFGCSGEDEAPKERVHFDAELTVPSGTETIQCKFVTMPDDEGQLAGSTRSDERGAGRVDHRVSTRRVELDLHPVRFGSARPRLPHELAEPHRTVVFAACASRHRIERRATAADLFADQTHVVGTIRQIVAGLERVRELFGDDGDRRER